MTSTTSSSLSPVMLFTLHLVLPELSTATMLFFVNVCIMCLLSSCALNPPVASCYIFCFLLTFSRFMMCGEMWFSVYCTLSHGVAPLLRFGKISAITSLKTSYSPLLPLCQTLSWRAPLLWDSCFCFFTLLLNMSLRSGSWFIESSAVLMLTPHPSIEFLI